MSYIHLRWFYSHQDFSSTIKQSVYSDQILLSHLEVLLVHQVRRDSDSRAHPKKVEHDDNLRFNTNATWL